MPSVQALYQQLCLSWFRVRAPNRKVNSKVPCKPFRSHMLILISRFILLESGHSCPKRMEAHLAFGNTEISSARPSFSRLSKSWCQPCPWSRARLSVAIPKLQLTGILHTLVNRNIGPPMMPLNSCRLTQLQERAKPKCHLGCTIFMQVEPVPIRSHSSSTVSPFPPTWTVSQDGPGTRSVPSQDEEDRVPLFTQAVRYDAPSQRPFSQLLAIGAHQ